MDEEIKESEKIIIIQNEMKPFSELLAGASDSVLSSGISKYPIFIVHKQDIDLGVQVVNRQKHSTNWSINISTLEEFFKRKLIVESKIDDFRKTYKNPKEHHCLFVLSDIGAQFMFMPRIINED